MRWLDIQTDEEAYRLVEAGWTETRAAIAEGRFWADEIKLLRDKPRARLALARDNLPLPGAFREAAVALRALIRAKRRGGEDYGDELRQLYDLAAWQSFGVPYSESLQQPGFNVLESVPGKTVQALPFSYEELGYRELGLLNKTDTGWLVEAWGEPAAHSTLHQLHVGVWQNYEIKLGARQAAQQQALWGEPEAGAARTGGKVAAQQRDHSVPAPSQGASRRLPVALVLAALILVAVGLWIGAA